MFFRSRTTSREQLAEAFAQPDMPENQEINLDSLSAYLRKQFPKREHSDAKDVSELISELSAADFKYIGEIDSHIDRGAEAFASYEEEHVGRNYFSDVGAVRGSLDIGSEKYRTVRVGKGYVTEDVERYRKMIKH